MTDIIYKILTLGGALVLFLFGMKIMSEGLQKVTGTRMRNILSSITSNKFKSILTGFVITSLIQSSSATTVMLVSFVNAGLISLIESIGVVMGANIGTTITSWLISILGFKFNISTLALPLMAVAAPLIFSNINLRKYWGEFIIGFAMIFLGLDFIKSTVPDISSNPELLRFVSEYNDMGFASILIFCFIGMAVTAIIQSSSAAMALTLVMCYKGWIGFELAAAMVIGENIGTTITANLAAIVANTTAKKTARVHFLFNIIGAIWVIMLMNPLLKISDFFTVQILGNSAFQNVNSVPVALCFFHTFFNVINTLLLFSFMPQLVNISKYLIIKKGHEEDVFRLKYINSGILMTSELSILQARKELALYAKRSLKQFELVKTLFLENRDRHFNIIFDKIKKYEEISDKMELEIATYLAKVSQSGVVSTKGSARIKTMLKVVDLMENINDTSYNLGKIILRKKHDKIWFTQELRTNVIQLFTKIEQIFNLMISNLEKDYAHASLEEVDKLENEIDELKNTLINEHANKLTKKNYKYEAGIIYSDIIKYGERIADQIWSVNKALEEKHQMPNNNNY